MEKQRRKSRYHHWLGILFLSSLSCCLWIDSSPSQPWQIRWGAVATAQAPKIKELVRHGVQQYQAGDYPGAIESWQNALAASEATDNPANQVVILENLARVSGQVGKMNQAITYWEQVAEKYHQLEDFPQVGRSMTEQAQGYNLLGQHQKAIALLCGDKENCLPNSALEIARTYQDKEGEAAALGSLGESYRLRGKYEQAIAYLQKSLDLAQTIENPTYRISALGSLGNSHASLAQIHYRRGNSAEILGDQGEADANRKLGLKDDAQALQYFQQSIELAQQQNNHFAQVQALLNSIPAYERRGEEGEAAQARQQVQLLLNSLPDSRAKVYGSINLAGLLQDNTASNQECLQPKQESKAVELLKGAVAIAQRLQDSRAESFALGELGHIYECRQDYGKALQLTQQAQWAAEQNLLAKDSLYLWEWQAGRILKAQGKNAEALATYEQAVATLEPIRSDILTANRDIQFDFRDRVEPIYREFIELQLASVPSIQTKGKTKGLTKSQTKNLNSALGIFDALKLAELQNYFGNDCDIAAFSQNNADAASQNKDTAVVSTITLKDRTAVILSLPNAQKRLSWINTDKETIRKKVIEFRRGLESFYDEYEPQPAQELYGQLIRPFESDLEQEQIKTLVFIHDGILRSVPMAALHDGEGFLIEKYAVATTPALTLTDLKPLQDQGLRVLALGLTESSIIDGSEFSELPNVAWEVEQVKAQLPGSQDLMNQEFTRDRLEQELNSVVYPIIHIATHGEFATEPEDTFLVMGNNQKLTINQLDEIIRRAAQSNEPIELLSLTACQTATGDDRAALGLAGVAVQAGAKSALASLWFVDDAATAEVATKFYEGLLDPNLNKAGALRAAQLELIQQGGEFAHPSYWAPYILIGNWL